eukprot:1558171-Pyramimonas_sp.AAC.1
MPLVAESASNAGTPAAIAPAALPAKAPWLRRMVRATERSAQWLQLSHAHMPYGSYIRPPAQPA